MDLATKKQSFLATENTLVYGGGLVYGGKLKL